MGRAARDDARRTWPRRGDPLDPRPIRRSRIFWPRLHAFAGRWQNHCRPGPHRHLSAPGHHAPLPAALRRRGDEHPRLSELLTTRIGILAVAGTSHGHPSGRLFRHDWRAARREWPIELAQSTSALAAYVAGPSMTPI